MPCYRPQVCESALQKVTKDLPAFKNYNYRMRFHRFLVWGLLIVFGVGAVYSPQAVRAAPLNQASAFDLIIAMNTLRVSYGLPALIEDPIVDAVAQSTAATMAANNMSWHIGDVRGRLAGIWPFTRNPDLPFPGLTRES